MNGQMNRGDEALQYTCSVGTKRSIWPGRDLGNREGVSVLHHIYAQCLTITHHEMGAYYTWVQESNKLMKMQDKDTRSQTEEHLNWVQYTLYKCRRNINTEGVELGEVH